MPALGTERLVFDERRNPRGEEGREGDVGFFTAGPDAIATVGKATIGRLMVCVASNLEWR
jgi:hypothetical protein